MSSRTSNGSRRASAARLLLVGALPLLVSSCVLRLVVSTVTVDTIGEEVDLTFEISAANVTAGVCRESPFSGVTECRYFVETVDGASQRTSTASLVCDFGLFGVLIDPLIVQVPAGTSVDRALVEDGVTVLDLVVTETECFEAEPGVALTAEAGQKLLNLRVSRRHHLLAARARPGLRPPIRVRRPAELASGDGSGAEHPLKALFAGRVEAGGQTFYPPIFPCVTDIADVPLLSVPLGSSPFFIFDILFYFFDNEALVCDAKVFDYTDAGGPPV